VCLHGAEFETGIYSSGRRVESLYQYQSKIIINLQEGKKPIVLNIIIKEGNENKKE